MAKMYDVINEIPDDEIVIDLREIFFALQSRIWAILLALIIGGGLAVVYSELIVTPMYSSTSMVYILSKETTLTTLADLQIGSQLTKDYRVVTTSRPVLQEVIDTLHLEMTYGQLKGMLTLENPTDTRILSITVKDADPVRAKAIVDHVAKISSEHIAEIMEMTPPKIIEEGTVATVKTSPSVKKNAMVGALAAVAVVCGLVVLEVVLNDTIQTEEEVERYLHLSVLAAIPERKEDAEKGKKKGKKLRESKRGNRK